MKEHTPLLVSKVDALVVKLTKDLGREITAEEVAFLHEIQHAAFNARFETDSRYLTMQGNWQLKPKN